MAKRKATATAAAPEATAAAPEATAAAPEATATATATAAAPEATAAAEEQKQAEVMKAAHDFVLAGDTAKVKACNLLSLLGFTEAATVAVAETVLKAAKKATKTAIEAAHGPFSVKDKSPQDKLYTALSRQLELLTEAARKPEKPAKETTATAPKAGTAPRTVVHREGPKEQPAYTGATFADEMVEFSGTIAEMVDTYQLEIFAFIKGTPEMLKAFETFTGEE